MKESLPYVVKWNDKCKYGEHIISRDEDGVWTEDRCVNLSKPYPINWKEYE